LPAKISATAKEGVMKKGAPSLKRLGLSFSPFQKVELLAMSDIPVRAQNSTGEPLIARGLSGYSHERTT
jgi:hypothetical protein